MLTIETINTENKDQVKRFTRFPFKIYKDNSYWVPPLFVDMEMALNRKKHPFYEHSEVDFFIAVRDGKDVGRIAALEYRNYNLYHSTKRGQFYFFECVDDIEVARALFDRVIDWSRQRGLDTVIGPKGLGVLDGYGLLVEGYEVRQLMNMLNYNPPYYPDLVEQIGFTKEVEFLSCYLNLNDFNIPDRVQRIVERVQERGTLTVKRFKDKKELSAWADRIGQAYNRAFVNNWEYAPLTPREINLILDNILTIAKPNLIKIILHNEDVVGFLFGFPDVSRGMQKAKGHLFPLGLLRILIDLRKTDMISFNGAGILPEYQGIGGNALLYSEMEKTVKEAGFIHADLTQVAETAEKMRADLINLGAKPYRLHRVYRLKI